VDGAFAGFTGLVWSDVTGTRELEVGWRLARPYWGRGLATEAATAALAYGLERVPRVVSFTALTNQRSRRVMERIGMRFEGEFDHPREDLGHLRRHVLYASP
jgi:RimJ/RimL family protein N-acetyltransferase